jgi:WD40 repeat protein
LSSHVHGQWRALLCGALALPLTLAPCFAAGKPPPPPSEEALRQQMMEMMGKGPPAQPTPNDAVEVIIQSGHAATVTAVALSPDGRTVLSGGMDEAVKLWDVASGQESRSFAGQGLAWPVAVAFSVDGARFLVSDIESTRIYEVGSGRLVRRIAASNGPLLLVGHGRWIIGETLIGEKRDLVVLDGASGDVVWTVPAAAGARAIACSNDGLRLATITPHLRARAGAAASSVELAVYDLAARKEQSHASVELPSSSFGFLAALSHDGALLVVENARRDLEFIDTRSGRSLKTLPSGARATSGMTTTLAFTPNDAALVWASGADEAKQWSMPDSQPQPDFAGSALAWSSDGHMLVLGHGTGGAPVLKDLTTGAETAMAAGASEVADLALVSGGQAALAAMHDGSAQWWDLANGQILRSFRCPGPGPANSVASSRTQALVALGCNDGSAVLFDAASGAQRQQPLAPEGTIDPVTLRFAPDGVTLVIARRNEVLVWDSAAGRELKHLTLPPMAAQAGGFAALRPPAGGAPAGAADAEHDEAEQWIRTLAVHPGGKLVAIGRVREVGLWDLQSGALLRQFTGSGLFPNPMMGPGVAIPSSKTGGGRNIPRGAVLGGLPTMGMPGAPTGMGNPLDALNEQMSQVGAHSMAFSPDGRVLLAIGTMGHHAWDVSSGQELGQQAAKSAFDPQQFMGAVAGMVGSAMTRGAAFSPDGRQAARAEGRVIRLWDVASGQPVADFKGHTSDVTAIAFSDDGKTLVSGGRDGTLRVWNVADARERVALTALGTQDYIAVTSDQYYRASKSRLQGVAFRVRGELYPFEQFDLRFNRPDIVLERLGRAPPELIESFRHAYERRLKKMGFTEAMLGKDFHLPLAEIATRDIALATTSRTLTLHVKASDSRYGLDRFLAYVNDVPVFGTAGVPIADHGRSAEADLTVPVVPGRNKIQVSALNQAGVESLRQTLYTQGSGDSGPSDIWVIAIGVSHYQNSRYDLRYAAKDAGDVAGVFQSRKSADAAPGAVHLLSVTDSQATREGIRAAREWLRAAKPQDLVVVFAAGHGMTDAQQNYFFGTFDIDPEHPATHGLPFEEFEGLLDGITPLKKLLLVDTCFSGEIEREEPAAVAPAAGEGKVTMRAFKAWRGVKVQADAGSPAGASLPAYVRFQQDWFADLRRGTGAAVISSSSGNEFSLEGEQWQNGVFTYAVLQGLKNGKADRNGDGVVTVSELESYVIETVRSLTAGAQNPTVRRENLDYDFPVY